MVTEIDISRVLAAEDVKPGQFVTILHRRCELLVDDTPLEAVFTPKRVVLERWPERSEVWRVERVCVPFVLAVGPKGRSVVLDTRRVVLARLSGRFGQAAERLLSTQACDDDEQASED